MGQPFFASGRGGAGQRKKISGWGGAVIFPGARPGRGGACIPDRPIQDAGHGQSVCGHSLMKLHRCESECWSEDRSSLSLTGTQHWRPHNLISLLAGSARYISSSLPGNTITNMI